MKTLFSLLFSFALFFCTGTFAQKKKLYPVVVDTAEFFAKTLPLTELPVIKPGNVLSEDNGDSIPNISRANSSDKDVEAIEYGTEVIQKSMGVKKKGEILANFEGIGNLQNKIPPDTEGDVGPDHYVQMINMSFAVFDKSGNLIYGPVANLTIWQNAPEPWSNYSNGDPIVLYDEQADRWLISELSFPNHPDPPYYEKIAVSATSDPTGAWFLYGFEYDYFCDYPKLSVWHDGYYMTTNNNYWTGSQWNFHAVGVSVFERDSMLAGVKPTRIFFDFHPNIEPWSVLPADFDGNPPPSETPAYLAYYKEGNPDRIRVYEVQTNWNEPSASTMQLSGTMLPESFSGSLPAGIPQPENAPYLAPMSNRLLYRLQYRNFDSCQTMVTNHTINVGNGVAGIRWYEFRNTGPGWYIHQQGTYSPDNTYRWMGSVAMDGYGNMALGYSVSSETVYPSIRYTGRLASDPPGVMTTEEQEVITGSGVQLSPYHRWGDYSCMSVDPSDQTTFWYTQEYYEISGDKSWQTRVASFHLNDFLELEVEADKDTACQNSIVQLYANAGGGSGNYSFLWYSDPPGFNDSVQNPTVSPDTSAYYYCQVFDSLNLVLDSTYIHVNPAPDAYAGPDTMICDYGTYTITQAEITNQAGFYWSSSGDGIFNDSTLLFPEYIPGEDDVFTGQVRLYLNAQPLPGCQENTDTALLVIDPCTGYTESPVSEQKIRIVPNPNNGSFTLLLGHFNEKVKLILRDLKGRIVFEQSFFAKAGENSIPVDCNDLSPGLYYAEVKVDKQSKLLKIVLNDSGLTE